MVDFLSFKTFISIDALIIFYYIGVIFLPVAAWFFMLWLVRKYQLFSGGYELGKEVLWSSLSVKQKNILLMFFVFIFFFMELFWRMMFEFLIAYMQMRDALVHM